TSQPYLLSVVLPSSTTYPTPTYTLSLHDALPISQIAQCVLPVGVRPEVDAEAVAPPHHLGDRHRDLRTALPSLPVQHQERERALDRKSTRLNSSHQIISYAGFCLKQKNRQIVHIH